MVLLLVSHHRYIGRRASDTLTLTVPNNRLCISNRSSSDRLRLSSLLLCLTTKNIGSCDCKAPQICRDVVSASEALISLPLLKLLLLLFALGIHDTELEVLSPLRLQDVLLAIRTLLVTF
mmetsp:Transcript_24347/g.28576  ORF Transcript_24347/g.28576 Transcript_24347/m.28576 type:complete len:120 (-) Transcript_24347:846-1205(-)